MPDDNWSTRSTYDRCLDLHQQIYGQYTNVNANRDIISLFFRPDLPQDTDEGLRGLLLNGDIYDSTPSWCAREAQKGLQGNLCSRSIDWIAHRMSQIEFTGLDKLDIWTQKITEHITGVHKRGNFYDVLPDYIMDGLSIGSPVMFGEEDMETGRIMWLPQHYKHSFVSYDKYNEPNGCIIRNPTFTAKDIFDKFADSKMEIADKTLSKAVVEAVKNGDRKSEFVIWRFTFKTNDRVWDGKFKKPIIDPRRPYKWISVYFEDATDKDKDTPLRTEIFYSRPFVVMNYQKKFYEPVSKTPAWYAIFDACSTNQTFKAFLENTQLKNRPPRIGIDTMRNRWDDSAGAMNWVDQKGYDRPPKPVDDIGDVQINKEVNDILTDKCKRHFHLDSYTKFNDIARSNRQPISVTQIWKIAAEDATLLTPDIDAVTSFLSCVDERTMDIERYAGRGPFAPDEMANIEDVIRSNMTRSMDSVDIMPEFVGLLARAQRVAQAVDPLKASCEFAAFVGQTLGDPDLPRLAVRGWNMLTDGIAALGGPEKNLRPEKEFNELYAATQQQRAEQKQFENQLEMAKAARGHGDKPIDPNSAMGLLTGAGKEQGV